MTTRDLHSMLEGVPDTREIVVRRIAEGDVLLAVWRVAAQDVRGAYAEWCAWPGAGAHAAYLAAVDQADAAVASLLAQQAGSRVLAPAA